MNEEIVWYLGAALLAWSVGWASGTLHRVMVQLAEQAV